MTWSTRSGSAAESAWLEARQSGELARQSSQPSRWDSSDETFGVGKAADRGEGELASCLFAADGAHCSHPISSRMSRSDLQGVEQTAPHSSLGNTEPGSDLAARKIVEVDVLDDRPVLGAEPPQGLFDLPAEHRLLGLVVD